MLIRRNMDAVFAWRKASADAGLSAAKAAARAQINAAVGSVRAEFITVAPGQDSIYSAKEAEARAYLAGDRRLADCPFLTAEVGITAPDAYQLAQLWLNLATQWGQIASRLEAIRLEWITKIDAAQDPSGLETALQMFLTDLGQVPK